MRVTVKLLKDSAGVPAGTIKTLPIVLAKDAESKGIVEIIGETSAPQAQADKPAQNKAEKPAKQKTKSPKK